MNSNMINPILSRSLWVVRLNFMMCINKLLEQCRSRVKSDQLTLKFPTLMGIRKPSKHRRSLRSLWEHTMSKKNFKTIDLVCQLPQLWSCNPQHILRSVLAMRKDGSSTPNTCNICFQAFRGTPSFCWWRIVIKYPPYLSLSSTHPRTPQPLNEKLIRWFNACWLAHAHIHQQNHGQLHRQACE
jgi:hypothetical protein